MPVISKKDADQGQKIPSRIDAEIKKAFTQQFLKKKFEEEFDATKATVKSMIEDKDSGLTLTKSESLKTPYGAILISETDKPEYDVDAIIKLIETKKVSVASVLQSCSFRKDDLNKALGDANFKAVATPKVTESFKFTSNSEFKQECETKFAELFATEGESEPVQKPAPKKAKSKGLVEDIREELVKTGKLKPKKAKTNSDDLDAILKK